MTKIQSPSKFQVGKRDPLLTAPRGCGAAPIAGGTYIVVPSGFYGVPIWNFLLDPTWVLPEGFNLAKLGMQLRPRADADGMPVIGKNGKQVYDLWDHIGSSGYPNPSDWIMEIAHLGFHQLISPNLEFEKITEESLYIAVHDRAHISDAVLYYEDRQPALQAPLCPRNNENHSNKTLIVGTCPGLFFEDLLGGTSTNQLSRQVKISMPSFDYVGYSPIANEIDHERAAFFRLPLGQMMKVYVYEDVETNKHDIALDKLKKLDEKLQRVTFIPLK